MRLWKCPNGCPAKLGPERPYKKATIRFCLECSAKSPMLVERTCAAAEKTRAAKTERAAAARVRARERRSTRRERAARTPAPSPYVHALVLGLAERRLDLMAELRRLWKTAQDAGLGQPRSKLPAFVVRRSRTKETTSGHAYYDGHQIALTLGKSAHVGHALGVLAHEVTHAIGHRGHGEEFFGALRSLVRLQWGIALTSTATNAREKHVEIERAIQDAFTLQPEPAPQT